MMGKTHFAMGIASALVIMNPKTVSECLLTIVGGAIGGVLCDIDILDNDYEGDGRSIQFTAIGMAVIGLLIDFLLKNGIWEYIYENNTSIEGVVLFLILWIIGVKSRHRTFTHSLFALSLFSLALFLIYPPIVSGFAIGFLSHILLDLLNKRKIQLFYPMDFRLCFNFCYADGFVNKALMYVGGWFSILFVIRCIALYFLQILHLI